MIEFGGTVTDEDDEPVEGALVGAIDRDTDEFIGIDSTDENGEWALEAEEGTDTHLLMQYEDDEGNLHHFDSAPGVVVTDDGGEPGDTLTGAPFDPPQADNIGLELAPFDPPGSDHVDFVIGPPDEPPATTGVVVTVGRDGRVPTSGGVVQLDQ